MTHTHTHIYATYLILEIFKRLPLINNIDNLQIREMILFEFHNFFLRKHSSCGGTTRPKKTP